MSKAFLYILKHYLKSFLIVLIGLVSIVTLIDYLQHLHAISGFNRSILYIYYTFSNLLNLLYPIALVFGGIMLVSNLLFKNHLLVLASFGYSKTLIIKPVLLVVFLTYLIMVALNFTDFAYSADRAKAISSNRDSLLTPVDNMFFKYNNSFISAKKMDIVNKELIDAKLYSIKDGKVQYILEFDKAKFKNKEWIATNVTKKSFIYKDGVPKGFNVEEINSTKILKGYYPRVVSLLYEGKRMSILDGLKAKRLLKEQNIDASKITSTLYERLIMPLFAPLLIVIIIILTPIHKRYYSRAKFFLWSIGSTLVVWSLLYSVNMMSMNGVIPAYLGQPLIILILFILTLYFWFKKKSAI